MVSPAGKPNLRLSPPERLLVVHESMRPLQILRGMGVTLGGSLTKIMSNTDKCCTKAGDDLNPGKK